MIASHPDAPNYVASSGVPRGFSWQGCTGDLLLCDIAVLLPGCLPNSIITVLSSGKAWLLGVQPKHRRGYVLDGGLFARFFRLTKFPSLRAKYASIDYCSYGGGGMYKEETQITTCSLSVRCFKHTQRHES